MSVISIAKALSKEISWVIGWEVNKLLNSEEIWIGSGLQYIAFI